MVVSLLVGSSKDAILFSLAFISVVLEVVDKSLSGTQILNNDFFDLEVPVFCVVVIVAIATQFLLIRYSKSVVMIERSKSLAGYILLRATVVLQGLISLFLVLISLEVLFSSRYNSFLVELVVAISLVTSTVLLAFLSLRFLQTIRYRMTKVSFMYAIATAMLSLNSITTLLYVESYLYLKPEVITSYYNPWQSFGAVGSANFVFAYEVIGIVSFLTIWLATVFLVPNQQVGSRNLKFLALTSVPLLYFASQFLITYLEDLDLIMRFRVENTSVYSYMYNLFVNTIAIAGGISFGIPFFVIARATKHAQLRRSIIMTGLAIIVLLGGNAASIIIIMNYPPWGAISFSFSLVASFCLMIGLDSAALYMASDASLRRMVKGTISANFDLFSSLGLAKTQDIIARRIENISHAVYKEIETDNMFRSISEPSNVREYVDEVIKEIQANKKGIDLESGST